MNCNIMHMSPSVILIVLLYKKMTKGYCLLLYSDKAAGLFFLSSQILTRIYPSQSYKFAVDCDVMQL